MYPTSAHPLQVCVAKCVSTTLKSGNEVHGIFTVPCAIVSNSHLSGVELLVCHVLIFTIVHLTVVNL